MRCTYCGSSQHTEANCPKTWGGSVNRIHMRCSYCGAGWHNADACPKRFSSNGVSRGRINDDFVRDK